MYGIGGDTRQLVVIVLFWVLNFDPSTFGIFEEIYWLLKVPHVFSYLTKRTSSVQLGVNNKRWISSKKNFDNICDTGKVAWQQTVLLLWI